MDDETREYIDMQIAISQAVLTTALDALSARLDQIEADHAGETEADTPEG